MRVTHRDVNDPIMRFVVDVTSGTTFRDVIDVLQSYIVYCETYMILVNVQFLYWSLAYIDAGVTSQQCDAARLDVMA